LPLVAMHAPAGVLVVDPASAMPAPIKIAEVEMPKARRLMDMMVPFVAFSAHALRRDS
jgi:hypothetical protein